MNCGGGQKQLCKYYLNVIKYFQFERVRVIYKYALDRIPKQDAQNLFKNYTIFEKKFGDRRGIEDIIVSKRRFQYEEEVKVCITDILWAHCVSSYCLRYVSISWCEG